MAGSICKMAISEISDATYDYNVDALTCMIYGPPGSGKTWFIGTMPDVYIISLDKGLLGLKLAGKKFNGCSVDTLDELNLVIDEIIAGTRAPKAGSFALDHLTAVTELGVVAKNLRNTPNTHKRSVWGAIADEVRIVVRKFVDIAYVRRVPICVAAHQKIEKNEITKNVLGTPDTVGKFAMTVGGFFDLYLYARQELVPVNGEQQAQFTVSTVDYIEFQAKDRTGQLSVTEPNDFNTIYAKIQARVDELKKGEA